MDNHTNKVVMIKTANGEWVSGDSFWPKTTSQIIKGVRLSSMADAKKYVKTAEKRLKQGKLKTVNAVAEYDGNWNLVNITEEV